MLSRDFIAFTASLFAQKNLKHILERKSVFLNLDLMISRNFMFVFVLGGATLKRLSHNLPSLTENASRAAIKDSYKGTRGTYPQY